MTFYSAYFSNTTSTATGTSSENVTSRFFFIPSTENYIFRSMELDSSLFSKDKKTVKTFFAVYLVLI